MAAPNTNTTSKPACKFGNKCYRKNPKHLSSFSHPNELENKKPSLNTPTSAEKVKEKQKRSITDYFKSAKDEDDSVSDSDTAEVQPQKKQKVVSSSSEEMEEKTEKSDNDDDIDSKTQVFPHDVRECIKQTFLVDMPEDFYHFWSFCKACNKGDPLSALGKNLGLKLAGPFDILAGRHKTFAKSKKGRKPNFLLHHRFFYDPPEFQTVLVSEDANDFHIGYFRDDPIEMPVFLASNTPSGSENNGREKLTQCGDNIFAAVHIYATKKSKSETGKKKQSIIALMQDIENEAKRLDLSLTPVTKQMKERQKNVNCPTFHGAGMVVPVDDNEVGYRPVPETQKDLKAMLRRMLDSETEGQREEASEALQEIITFIQFANDECDYGEGLELGLCLFSYGRKELHPQISLLMPLAYQLLNRPVFKSIIEDHLNNRRDVGCCVDELKI